MSEHDADGSTLCIHSVVTLTALRRKGLGQWMVRAYRASVAALPTRRGASSSCARSRSSSSIRARASSSSARAASSGQDRWLLMSADDALRGLIDPHRHLVATSRYTLYSVRKRALDVALRQLLLDVAVILGRRVARRRDAARRRAAHDAHAQGYARPSDCRPSPAASRSESRCGGGSARRTARRGCRRARRRDGAAAPHRGGGAPAAEHRGDERQPQNCVHLAAQTARSARRRWAPAACGARGGRRPSATACAATRAGVNATTQKKLLKLVSIEYCRSSLANLSMTVLIRSGSTSTVYVRLGTRSRGEPRAGALRAAAAASGTPELSDLDMARVTTHYLDSDGRPQLLTRSTPIRRCARRRRSTSPSRTRSRSSCRPSR